MLINLTVIFTSYQSNGSDLRTLFCVVKTDIIWEIYGERRVMYKCVMKLSWIRTRFWNSRIRSKVKLQVILRSKDMIICYNIVYLFKFSINLYCVQDDRHSKKNSVYQNHCHWLRIWYIVTVVVHYWIVFLSTVFTYNLS